MGGSRPPQQSRHPQPLPTSRAPGALAVSVLSAGDAFETTSHPGDAVYDRASRARKSPDVPTSGSIPATVFASNDARWMAAGVLAFVLFLTVSAAAFRWRRRARDTADDLRLLVLRVFALGRRSRRLFDRIADRWRYFGSVQLIAGPDLAASTVQPHEFFDFLRRRLGARFIADDTAIDRRFAEIDSAPDHDARFRVTDFFCHDQVWQTVLGRLATNSDVVSARILPRERRLQVSANC